MDEAEQEPRAADLFEAPTSVARSARSGKERSVSPVMADEHFGRDNIRVDGFTCETPDAEFDTLAPTTVNSPDCAFIFTYSLALREMLCLSPHSE